VERQGPKQEGNLVGALLDGRYRVGPVLARGGMSTVFRGTDTRLERPVAIKVMDPRFAADPVFLQRFEREARAAARLHHPGIVGVYDQGVDPGRSSPDGTAGTTHVFLVMELIDGGTLRDLLQERGKLPVPLALAVTDLVLSALAAAHREGLVHRDVKPENVLIGPGGVVKVADFGLVRAVAEANSSTGDVILGTVAYLSPEQVATGAADARSDVYAAGVLLFEMLTGTPPYTGETALSVAYRHVNDDVPAPSTVGASVPAAVDDLVVRATRRDPAARPSDAATFLTALWRVRAELGIGPVAIPAPMTAATTAGATLAPRTDPHGIAAWPGGSAASTAVAAPPSDHGPRGTRAMTRAQAPLVDPAAQRRRGSSPPQPDQYGEDPYERERSRNRRAFTAWIVFVLLLATMIGVAAWWLGSGRWTAVPDLRGMQRAAAETALSDAGLEARLAEDHNDTVPNGTVITSDPASGGRAVRGSEVTVVLSLGHPVVPTLAVGARAEDIERLLADADLSPLRDPGAQQFHDTVPVGRVIGLTPASGTVLTVGAPVTLVISKGPGPTAVPDVRGLPEAQAVATLADAGLKAQVQREFDDAVPGGHAIGTDPDKGESTTRGTGVTLLVSTALVVPEVVGQPREQALATLTAAGFSPDERGDGAGQPGATVQSLEPGAGSLVDPGDNGVSVQMSNKIEVPDVVGRSVTEASRILTAAGLKPDVNQFFGDSSSRVVAQFPGARRNVRPGSTIHLTTF
jgi:beta-lactam-binding protein with PASTA domain/tRNA A-37 threonylcarbamoyl transferase component Bud32